MEHPATAPPRRRSPEPARLLNRLSAVAERDRPVAFRGKDVVSESEFRGRVAGWAALFSPGLGRDVALYATDGAEFAAALFGAWHSGATVHLPGDTLPATCRALAGGGAMFAGDFPAEHAPLAPPPAATPRERLSRSAAISPGVVIYTSGSTGEPRALRKKLSQLAAEVDTLERQFGERVGDAAMVVATVSHQHIYGLLFKILWPLCARRPFLAESLAYPEQLVARLGDTRAVLVSGPAHLKRLPDALDWTNARRSTCAIFSSGGPLAADSAANVERLLGQRRWKCTAVPRREGSRGASAPAAPSGGGHRSRAWTCVPTRRRSRCVPAISPTTPGFPSPMRVKCTPTEPSRSPAGSIASRRSKASACPLRR